MLSMLNSFVIYGFARCVFTYLAKLIGTLSASLAGEILAVMVVDTEQSVPFCVALLQFIFDVVPLIGLRSDQDNGNRSACKLCIYPTMDRSVAFLLYFLESGFVQKASGVSVLGDPTVAYLVGTGHVVIVVEAKEYFSRHRF
jgi:hypothetical protein